MKKYKETKELVKELYIGIESLGLWDIDKDLSFKGCSCEYIVSKIDFQINSLKELKKQLKTINKEQQECTYSGINIFDPILERLEK